MSDDEQLFEDLYGDDEVVEKKEEETVKEQEEQKEEEPKVEVQQEEPKEKVETKQEESIEQQSVQQEDSTAPPPPPPPQAADANDQQYGVPPPQMPFDPSQYQQMMASAQQGGSFPPPPPPAAAVVAAAPPPPPASSAPAASSAKTFLGGLDWQTTEEKLVEHFSKYGEIVDYTIMKDNATGRSRGFGFLTFKDPASVDALLKDRHILDGKLIDPKRAISKEDQEKVGKIFIGGIDPMVTEQEFDEFFSQFGKIIDCQLMIDKDTGRSRGFGFITYDSPAAVDRVCVNKYLTLKGKAMEVKRAAPRGQHNQQVAAQQAAAHQAQAQAAAAAAGQGVPMYPYGAPGAGVPGAAAGAVPPTAGYPMMNPATMNQDYMRYYQWYMYQQAAQAAQGGAAAGGSTSPDGGAGNMPVPLNPQQQAADDDQEKPPERPNIPTGPKRAPPLGPSYRGRGRGGYRRGRGGYHPYSRGGGRRY